MNQSIHYLQELVKLPTVNGHEEIVADYLEKLLKTHHISVKRIPFNKGRVNLVAEIGEGNGPVLAFDGHSDVVHPGDESSWTYPPFSGTVVDGKLYGRGVTDMKAGLMAAVIAMIRLKNKNIAIQGTIRLLVTVGEEIGLYGAQQLAEMGYADDIESLVVCEPSGVTRTLALQNPKLASGLDPNGPDEQRLIFIAHKGSLTYQVIAKGKAAHSSMPELGKDAIAALVAYYNAQAVYFNQVQVRDDILGEMTPVVTMIAGGEQENTVADSAQLTTKIRTIPELSNAELLNDLTKLTEQISQELGVELVLSVQQNALPVKSNPTSKIAQLTQKIAENHFSDKVPLMGISGCTDASKFIEKNPSINVVVLGPGNQTAHQIDEYVSLEAYAACIDCYEDIMIDYFK